MRTSASWPSARSSSQRPAVRRSCQTSARCSGSPDSGSHTQTVSRWFVMPIACSSPSPAPASSSASSATARVTSQISAASCSTQPGSREVLVELAVRPTRRAGRRRRRRGTSCRSCPGRSRGSRGASYPEPWASANGRPRKQAGTGRSRSRPASIGIRDTATHWVRARGCSGAPPATGMSAGSAAIQGTDASGRAPSDVGPNSGAGRSTSGRSPGRMSTRNRRRGEGTVTPRPRRDAKAPSHGPTAWSTSRRADADAGDGDRRAGLRGLGARDAARLGRRPPPRRRRRRPGERRRRPPRASAHAAGASACWRSRRARAACACSAVSTGC